MRSRWQMYIGVAVVLGVFVWVLGSYTQAQAGRPLGQAELGETFGACCEGTYFKNHSDCRGPYYVCPSCMIPRCSNHIPRFHCPGMYFCDFKQCYGESPSNICHFFHKAKCNWDRNCIVDNVFSDFGCQVGTYECEFNPGSTCEACGESVAFGHTYVYEHECY